MSKMAIDFRPLLEMVKEVQPALQPAAEATLASLKKEVEKSEQGEKPDDTVIAGLLKGLVGLVPSAVSAIASAFGTPILGALAGPATQLALKELGADRQ